MCSIDNKVLTIDEVKQLAEDKSKCIMVIDGNVYDVTKFLDEHPGGEEVLKEQHGRDASNTFEDIGHSSDAREQMKAYKIAKLHTKDVKKSRGPLIINQNAAANDNREDAGPSWSKWIIPLVIAVAAVVLFKLLSKPGSDGARPPRAI